MIQLYFITMGLLIISALVFLSDYYGWKYILLLKTRNYIESKSSITLTSIIIVVIVIVLNCFFPIPPGPILLGEFLPLLALFLFLIYLILVLKGQVGKKNDTGDEKSPTTSPMIERTHSLIETHKRNIGFFIIIVTLLHFIYPQGVLF